MGEVAPDGAHEFDKEYVREALHEFVANPGFDELALLFGAGKLPEHPRERLAVLQATAAKHWDFRNGRERHEVGDWSHALLDKPGSPQWEAIFSAATKLGMIEPSRPRNRNPEYLVILGGTNHAPLDRLRYGLESVDDFSYVVFLGSSRPLDHKEQRHTRDYALRARTEFELGCAAFERVFDAKVFSRDKTPRNGDTWAWQAYVFKHKGKERVGFALSTPQVVDTPGASTDRATTYDNYDFFAARAELADNPGTSVVAVSSGIYVPGQHFPAMQMLTLPHGAMVETIGSGAICDGKFPKPAKVLQEMKAAIDAAVELDRALAA